MRVNFNKSLGPRSLSPDRPPFQPKVSIQTHTFKQLLNFLRQYEETCPDLQLVCPWAGEPLPSIDANIGPEMSLHVDLSYQMASALSIYLR